ncbi:hypothetical protein HNO88_003727 [Novosphingobium chloroacetimidivorans]|uniref:Uncharacterized protein n=1 Tax=Novosphingobium chloroacetimidivorans TaxID=1428314 RepID=A0A7W7KCM6_9SPHN|nr:hypothetical protein [Novosphingobium chloroacetimidivorans]
MLYLACGDLSGDQLEPVVCIHCDDYRPAVLLHKCDWGEPVAAFGLLKRGVDWSEPVRLGFTLDRVGKGALARWAQDDVSALGAHGARSHVIGLKLGADTQEEIAHGLLEATAFCLCTLDRDAGHQEPA